MVITDQNPHARISTKRTARLPQRWDPFLAMCCAHLLAARVNLLFHVIVLLFLLHVTCAGTKHPDV
jgi:hypothetical protein